MSDSSMLHINHLPDSILVKIFSYTGQDLLRHTVQLVCRDWQLLSYDTSLWKDCFPEWSLFTDRTFSLLLAKIGHGIQVLNLDNCHGLSEQALLTVAEYCTHLSEIKWYNMATGRKSEEVLRNFVTRCPHLRRYDFNAQMQCYPGVLDLCTGHITSLCVLDELLGFHQEPDNVFPRTLMTIAEQNPGIRKLVTSGLVFGNSLEEFCRRCPCLESVSIQGAVWTVNETVSAACNLLKSLTSVNISDTLIDDWTIGELAKSCRTLKAVNISGCRKITDVGISSLTKHCPGIRRLVLNDSQYKSGNVTDVGLKDLAMHLPGLKVLYISFCPSVTPVGVRAVAEKFPGLEQIHMAGCVALTDPAFLALAAHCKRLHTIDASQCLQLHSAAAQQMLTDLPQLHTLQLESCRAVSEFNLSAPLMDYKLTHRSGSNPLTESLAHTCTEANSSIRPESRDDALNINTNASTDATDADYSEILEPRTSCLTHLSLNFCSQLQPSALISLARFCPRLQFINLTACCELTDACLSILTKECTLLRHLDLSSGSSFRLSNLSDTTLYSIAENCANLQELHLKTSFTVTLAGLTAVLKQVASLKLLSLTLGKNLFFGDVVQAIKNYHGHCQLWDSMGGGRLINVNTYPLHHSGSCTFLMSPLKFRSEP